MHWYYQLLARRPHFVVSCIGVVSVACIVVALVAKKLPDFDDPTLGFETRGTSIGRRWTAWRNLLEETSPSGQLTANPKEIFSERDLAPGLRFGGTFGTIRKQKKNKNPYGDEKKRPKKPNKWRILKELEILTKANIEKTFGLKPNYSSTEKTVDLKEPNMPNNYSTGKMVDLKEPNMPNNFSTGKMVDLKEPNMTNNYSTGKMVDLKEPTNYSTGKMVNFEKYEDDKDTFSRYHDNWKFARDIIYTEKVGNKMVEKKHPRWEQLMNYLWPYAPVDEFFCEPPHREFAHFVVQRVNYNLNDTLLELNALLALCDLEQRIGRTERYQELCQKQHIGGCCRQWSMANYVTLLSHKNNCFELDEEDIRTVKTLLFDCFPFYHNKTLSIDCEQSNCDAPDECKPHNAVYDILHFLTDVNFIKLNESAEFLNATMIFLPIAKSTKALEFFRNLRQENLGNVLVAVVAIDMGLKNELFDESLLRDGWLVLLGAIFVVISLWFYTKTLFVTLMTMVAVIFSLGIAYFFYAVIFELSFFPFMNLLTVIVIVGIGFDDAFIFFKIWQCVHEDRARNSRPASPTGLAVIPLEEIAANREREERPHNDGNETNSLINIMTFTLKHAALSMLVTSLTTAAAFYASYVSSITAIRCFGIFSGTAVMTNCLLMITWLPAAVSIAQRVEVVALVRPIERFQTRVGTLFKDVIQFGTKVENLIISLVINFPLLWIALLGITGIVSGVMVLHWPKLQLLDSPDFKLFVDSHPFERYDSEYRNMFGFEKIYGDSDTFKLPLRFVWGVQPVDRGNYLDPERRGPLYYDESFHMSAPESQQWLLEFCKSLKNQSFYQMSNGSLQRNCFIENFITWMGRPCNDTTTGKVGQKPCCDELSFPFAPDVFDVCLPESISSLYETPQENFIPGVAGPKFARQKESGQKGGVVKAVIIEYESNQVFTMSYGEIDGFVRTVEEWFGRMLADAPAEMRNGWFTSELEFFDLQDTLSTGTLVAICLALAAALLVSLLVTRNVLISLYAIVTVMFSILTSVAVLVLLGWKLNVLESVAVPTAIGLAVDFSLHYGVNYRLAANSNRMSSTKFSMKRMIGPTAMAALTTGIAGALMLPSTVLAYIQLGVFLVIVMSISWIYATFFLMSLLRVFGPQHGSRQLRYPRLRNTLRDRANRQMNDVNRRMSHHSLGSQQMLNSKSNASTTHQSAPIHNTMSSELSPQDYDSAFQKGAPRREQSSSTIADIPELMDDADSKDD